MRNAFTLLRFLFATYLIQWCETKTDAVFAVANRIVNNLFLGLAVCDVVIGVLVHND